MADLKDYPLFLNNPGFGELDAKVVQQLLDIAQTHSLEPGEALYHQGQQAKAIYAVMSGTMRLGLTTPEGREFVLAYMSNGLIFGESGFFDSSSMQHSAAAITPVELLVFPIKALESLLETEAILYKSLSLLLARRTRLVIDMLSGFARDGFERRLAKRMLLLASTFGVEQKGVKQQEVQKQGGKQQGVKQQGNTQQEVTQSGKGSVSLLIAQEELGAMLGVTRQSVYKTLKRWEDEGWVKLDYGTITLISH